MPRERVVQDQRPTFSHRPIGMLCVDRNQRSRGEEQHAPRRLHHAASGLPAMALARFALEPPRADAPIATQLISPSLSLL